MWDQTSFEMEEKDSTTRSNMYLSIVVYTQNGLHGLDGDLIDDEQVGYKYSNLSLFFSICIFECFLKALYPFIQLIVNSTYKIL